MATLKNGGVPGRKDEPIAVEPIGLFGVVTHDPGPENMGQWGESHGRARVSVTGFLHGIHGQATDDLHSVLLYLGCGDDGRGTHIR